MSWRGEFLWVAGLIAIIVTEAWAIRDPKPDSVSAWLAALISFVAIDRVARKPARPSITSQAHPNDPPLMRELLIDLPAVHIQFFREHDFLAVFEHDDVRPLRYFINKWDSPDHTFQDASLEEARSGLLNAAVACSRLIAFKTRPLSGDLLTVKAVREDDDPYPDWVRKDAEEMNAAADILVDAYDRLVLLGRKKLNIASSRQNRERTAIS